MLLSCPLCCKPHFEGVDSLRTTLINVATAPLNCPVCQETLRGLDKLTIHLFGHVNTSVYSDIVKKEKIIGTAVHQSSCGANTQDKFDKNVKLGDILTEEKMGQESPPLDTKQHNIQRGDDDVIACDICSFTFNDKNILEMHQKLLHQTTPDEKTGKYSYHCHLCSKRFMMRGSLMVHLRVAHYGFSNHIDLPPRSLDNNGEISENFQKNKAMEVDSTTSTMTKLQDCKQWSCDVCAKMFTTKYFLKKHKRLHTGEMPYSCTICNKSFTFQQSYHKHMLYHSSEKPYVCNECGRAFKEHSTLQNHARIHSGERPFGCEICGKKFRQRVSYLVHMRIHTGVMPYKCTACNKSFRYKVSQRSHKCPMNPPGLVIRVNGPENNNLLKPDVFIDENKTLSQGNELSISTTKSVNNLDPPATSNNGSKCIMAVDFDTGNINIIPENVLKISQMCDVNESSQETPVQTLVLCPEEANKNRVLENCLNKNCLAQPKDIFSMALSPILTEVESLCLNNNSPVRHSTSPIEENIQLIREKCLEELFK